MPQIPPGGYIVTSTRTISSTSKHLRSMRASDRILLADIAVEYRAYRQDVNAFLATHLVGVCVQKCYQNRLLFAFDVYAQQPGANTGEAASQIAACRDKC